MPTAQQLTDLKQAAAQLAIQYHHWRCEGFPTDHRYYLGQSFPMTRGLLEVALDAERA